jgi:hypothetical protein
MPVIPVVPWSSAPPPVPPRSFSTEPPPTQSPPSEPTLPRYEPLDARAFMMNASDPNRAEQVRDEARGLVHQALEEGLAPLHFRVHELQRRIEALEQARADAEAEPEPEPPTPPPPQVMQRAYAPQPPPMAFAPPPPPMAFAPPPPAQMGYAPPAPAQMAYAPQPPPMAYAPAAPAYAPPAEPFVGGAVLPRPPAISVGGYDIDVPFDGARRKRRVLVAFAILFVVLLGGLLASMAMSYSR